MPEKCVFVAGSRRPKKKIRRRPRTVSDWILSVDDFLRCQAETRSIVVPIVKEAAAIASRKIEFKTIAKEASKVASEKEFHRYRAQLRALLTRVAAEAAAIAVRKAALKFIATEAAIDARGWSAKRLFVANHPFALPANDEPSLSAPSVAYFVSPSGKRQRFDSSDDVSISEFEEARGSSHMVCTFCPVSGSAILLLRIFHGISNSSFALESCQFRMPLPPILTMKFLYLNLLYSPQTHG